MATELERKKRVISMMITMHSIKAHNLKTRALIGNIFFVLVAIILNALNFFDAKFLTFLDLTSSQIASYINISSFIVFLLSIVFLLIEWQKRSERHHFAVNQLTRLLNKIRMIKESISNSEINAQMDLFNELHSQTLESLPKIKDSDFNKLKAKHWQKIELSKFIDIHKGKPYIIIRVLFLYHQTLKRDDKRKSKLK